MRHAGGYVLLGRCLHQQQKANESEIPLYLPWPRSAGDSPRTRLGVQLLGNCLHLDQSNGVKAIAHVSHHLKPHLPPTPIFTRSGSKWESRAFGRGHRP